MRKVLNFSGLLKRVFATVPDTTEEVCEIVAIPNLISLAMTCMGGVVVPPAQPLFKVEAASMTHSGWQAIEETPPQALGRDFKADLVDLLSSNILQDFGIVHQAAGRSRERPRVGS